MFWIGDTRTWGRYATAGLQFTITFMGFLAVGIWIDRVRGTLPAYTLVLGVLGFALGLYRLVRQARQVREEARRVQQEDQDAPAPETESKPGAPASGPGRDSPWLEIDRDLPDLPGRDHGRTRK